MGASFLNFCFEKCGIDSVIIFSSSCMCFPTYLLLYWKVLKWCGFYYSVQFFVCDSDAPVNVARRSMVLAKTYCSIYKWSLFKNSYLCIDQRFSFFSSINTHSFVSNIFVRLIDVKTPIQRRNNQCKYMFLVITNIGCRVCFLWACAKLETFKYHPVVNYKFAWLLSCHINPGLNLVIRLGVEFLPVEFP